MTGTGEGALGLAPLGTTPGARAAALIEHSFRQTFRGRRLVVFAILLLVPAALVVAVAAVSDAQDERAADQDLQDVARFVGLVLVLPLTALFLGTAVLRDELETGTVVHLVTRPVDRGVIVVTRLIGAAAACVVLTGLSSTLAAMAVGGAFVERILDGLWLALLAAPAYTGVFALLGAVTKRAMIVGLLFVVAWEGPIASLPTFLRQLTVGFWARSVAYEQDPSGFLRGAAGNDPAGSGASTAVLVLVVLVSAAAAAWSFRRREFPGPEPE